jgi:hypothetical protein
LGTTRRAGNESGDGLHHNEEKKEQDADEESSMQVRPKEPEHRKYRQKDCCAVALVPEEEEEKSIEEIGEQMRASRESISDCRDGKEKKKESDETRYVVAAHGAVDEQDQE